MSTYFVVSNKAKQPFYNISALLLFCSFMLLSLALTAQTTFDAPMSKKAMQKDLDLFRDIRTAANSGVHKYRTEAQMDSMYTWAYAAINETKTIGGFYTILCKITDFEGSLHNDTQLPKEITANLKKEKTGYFPFTMKLVEDQFVCNQKGIPIPVGTPIIAVNGQKLTEIAPEFYPYYTTDGFNISGKKMGINKRFPLYYRQLYGQKKSFEVSFIGQNEQVEQATVQSVSYAQYKANFDNRHSKAADSIYYDDYDEELMEKGQLYYTQYINDSTALLVVNSFAIGGNASDPIHKKYVQFLDSVFVDYKNKSIQHLIVDVRTNGGGTDPNDLVTYCYLTKRNFQENTEAWISFRKIPYWNRIKGELPWWQKPLAKPIFQKMLKKEFPVEKAGKYYQDANSNDHKVWTPNPNAFDGQIYLLISPRIGSAGSLFAALLASDESTITIGEETMGAYHGHNGHTPIRYQLKASKIKTAWSLVNLNQDVREKPNQPLGSGIMPDYRVVPSYEDFLKNEDTVMKYVLEGIGKGFE